MIKKSLALLFLWTSFGLSAQTIWNAEFITFTKEDNADFTLEENQDRITDNVWITRGNTQGVFNIVNETSFISGLSPSDTEWSFGTTEEFESLTFEIWESAINNNPQGSIGQPMVLHLITDDIFIDITFTSFTGGGPGGGVSYSRASEETLSIDLVSEKANNIFVNKKIVTFPKHNSSISYSIFNLLGEKVGNGIVESNSPLILDNLENGVYFITLDDLSPYKLLLY